MKQRLRTRGKRAAMKVTRFSGGATAAELESLRERVAVLEVEVQECRQLNLRLAELTDVVQELLLPIAVRDEAKVAELIERYAKGV